MLVGRITNLLDRPSHRHRVVVATEEAAFRVLAVMAIVSVKNPSCQLKYSCSEIMAKRRDRACHFWQRREGGNEIRNDVEVAASAAAERVMKVERRRDGGRADSIHFVSVARLVVVSFRLGWVGVRFRFVAG